MSKTSSLNQGVFDAMHATAVAIGGRALLIRGPSKAGKSRLALTLIAASTKGRSIRLIGDDRVLLADRDGSVTARAHPRIAGFIERRGLGIVAMPHIRQATLVGVVELVALDRGEPTARVSIATQNLPSLAIVKTLAVDDQRDAVLAWWSTACAATASHTPPKAAQRRRSVT